MAPASRRSLAALLLASACGVPDGRVQLELPAGDGTQQIHDSPNLSVRMTGDEVALLHDNEPLDRGTGATGEVLRADVEGQRIELEFLGANLDTQCDPDDPRHPRRTTRCRDRLWLRAELRSLDGPLPGTTPTLHGAVPREFLSHALPGLAAGVLVGLVLLRSIGVGLILAILTLTAAVLIPRDLDESFAITHALAFIACAALGLTAAITWHENSRVAGLAVALGTLVGTLAVVLAYPLWGLAGPLLAVAAAVPAIVVLGLAAYALTTALGDYHRVSRWLLTTPVKRR